MKYIVPIPWVVNGTAGISGATDLPSRKNTATSPLILIVNRNAPLLYRFIQVIQKSKTSAAIKHARAIIVAVK